MMKGDDDMLMHFLIDTTIGDRICWLIERLTGCALVPLHDLDCRAMATDRGRAAAKGEAIAAKSDRGLVGATHDAP